MTHTVSKMETGLGAGGWGGGGKEEQEEKTRKGPVSHLPSRAMGAGNLASFTELSVHLLPTLHVRHRQINFN